MSNIKNTNKKGTIQPVLNDRLVNKFKQAFPEFSLEIITWFRKHKHLL